MSNFTISNERAYRTLVQYIEDTHWEEVTGTVYLPIDAAAFDHVTGLGSARLVIEEQQLTMYEFTDKMLLTGQTVWSWVGENNVNRIIGFIDSTIRDY